jgi:hypothetical protein
MGAAIARTGNEGDGVFAAELGGLEDVLVDRGHGCRLSVYRASQMCTGARILRVAIEGPVHRAAGLAPRRSVCHTVSWRVLAGMAQLGHRSVARTWAVFWELLDSIFGG